MHRIYKVCILGSGIMGSGIACHFVNAGFEVLMLDIANHDNSLGNKNAIVNSALQKSINSTPDPLFSKSLLHKIKVGNFDDDFSIINEYDWIIEVVKENLEIKKAIFDKVEKYRKPGSIITSNTSGIPIKLMSIGRSDDFQRNFCGTHFFNPPRYLSLLEIIPGPNTDSDLIDFLMNFGKTFLGKQTVLAKDTPAFIANRIGVYSMGRIFQYTKELGLSIQAVDKLTGAAIGRPNSGTFRLNDIVGLDTAYVVSKGIKESNSDDKLASQLETPDYFQFLVDNKFFGNKTGQGFYKKTDQKDEKGKFIFLGLNLQTLEYENDPKQQLESIGLTKKIDDVSQRIKKIVESPDAGGLLIKKSLASTLNYSATMIPSVSDHIYAIDTALKAGFAWDYGPFEYWDILGIEKGISYINELNQTVPDWITEMFENGFKHFYKVQGGKKFYYDIEKKDYLIVPGSEAAINLNLIENEKIVFQNEEVKLYDIGDEVLCLEFTSKMNAIGGGILNGLQDAIHIAENNNWRGVVIGNHSKNFTVGANLMMIAMLAYEQEFDELNQAVHLFQQTTLKCRTSKIPVVAATQGYVFGGGCEIIMHCDSTAVAAESYIGLVEVGVGLIPGGGGTKEFAVRASDQFYEGDVQIPRLIELFKTIATANVATSGLKAFELNYLNKKDFLVMNSLDVIAKAKEKVIQLSPNYVPIGPRKDIKVLGQSGLGALFAAAHSLKLGKYASDHDVKIAHKIAWVLCGGDFSSTQLVSEQYLLDLEREAFLSLCGETKTLARIQHMLETGKPLRN